MTLSDHKGKQLIRDTIHKYLLQNFRKMFILLTKPVKDGIGRVELDEFSLVEEVLVDVAGAKEPRVAIIRDGALTQASQFQEGALRFRFHGAHYVWHTKQLQQLLQGHEAKVKVSLGINQVN
jgi:hypothetical protein